MTSFMLAAAAMLLVALAFVIVPLLRSSGRAGGTHETLAVLHDSLRELDAEHAAGRISDADRDTSRRRIERQALEADAVLLARRDADARAGWSAALASGIALPLLAIAVYVGVGQPAALLADSVTPGRAGNGHERPDMAIETLSRRLEKDSGNSEGWVLLARSYLAANRAVDALGAYRKAVALLPDNADLLVEYANALGIANNRSLTGKPQQLVERALQIAPDNLNALALAGAAALQDGKRELALTHWTRLAGLLDPASDDGRRIAALLALARGDAPGGMAQGAGSADAVPNNASSVAARSAAAPAADTAIRGTVTIAGELAGKVAPTDTLFIFAKAAGGPPMPVAVMRTRAGAWPVQFKLDDSSAMVEGMALSHFARVNIVARVSRLDNATPQPGDVEGHVEDIAPGSREVHVVLDRVIAR